MSLQESLLGHRGSPRAHLGHHLQREVTTSIEGSGAVGAKYIQYHGQVRPLHQRARQWWAARWQERLMKVLRCIGRQLFCQGTCYGQGQEAGQGLSVWPIAPAPKEPVTGEVGYIGASLDLLI